MGKGAMTKKRLDVIITITDKIKHAGLEDFLSL
jgi:hypothetical protein